MLESVRPSGDSFCPLAGAPAGAPNKGYRWKAIPFPSASTQCSPQASGQKHGLGALAEKSDSKSLRDGSPGQGPSAELMGGGV